MSWQALPCEYDPDMAFEDLRQDYEGAPFQMADCAPDPVVQFESWMAQAVAAGIEMANAMTLATVDDEGAPHARIVLLKDVDARGFVFFTNYESHKGNELAVCNKASLLFWWHAMTRQVRIEGIVEKVSSEESDAYFRTRPRESNLAAIASPQSRPIENREALETLISDVRQASDGEELQRPAHWGGYRVKPTKLEFWQGRPDRSHDRIQYVLADGGWSLSRLCP
jgi:pyridoxamine 5'-phosphate oxidase